MDSLAEDCRRRRQILLDLMHRVLAEYSLVAVQRRAHST